MSPPISRVPWVMMCLLSHSITVASASPPTLIHRSPHALEVHRLGLDLVFLDRENGVLLHREDGDHRIGRPELLATFVHILTSEGVMWMTQLHDHDPEATADIRVRAGAYRIDTAVETRDSRRFSEMLCPARIQPTIHTAAAGTLFFLDRSGLLFRYTEDAHRIKQRLIDDGLGIDEFLERLEQASELAVAQIPLDVRLQEIHGAGKVLWMVDDSDRLGRIELRPGAAREPDWLGKLPSVMELSATEDVCAALGVDGSLNVFREGRLTEVLSAEPRRSFLDPGSGRARFANGRWHSHVKARRRRVAVGQEGVYLAEDRQALSRFSFEGRVWVELLAPGGGAIRDLFHDGDRVLAVLDRGFLRSNQVLEFRL